MPAIPIISAVSAVGGLALGVKGQQDARKAANQAADAAKNAGVNIPQVTQQAHDQAIQNAYDSAALEKQLNPLAPQLRTQSMQAIIDQLKGGKYDDAVQSQLFDQFKNGSNVSAPAFQDYGQGQLSQQSQAEALRQLQLGGKLDQETANQVIRSSAAHAGQFGNLGLGRDLSARDLGLSSLQLQQQRLATAGQFGQAQDAFTAQHAAAQNAYGLNSAQLALQQQQQQASLGLNLFQLGQTGFNRALAAGQFGQSIAQPVTGLDPSAIANLAVGNSNAQTSASQNAAAIRAQGGQGLSALGGQAIGLGASLYSQYGNKPSYGYISPTTYGNTSYVPPASPTGGAYLGTFGPGP